MGYLQYGVMQGEGFIVITGEIGAGKTTLLRTLLEGLDRQKVLAAQIVSTQLESGELLQAIITAFGIPGQGSSKAHLIATLEAFLTALAAQGRHALLIVDESQNLNERAVEELRMLSNFQLGELFVNRGICYLETKKYDKALVDFSEAIKQKKDFAVAYFNRANTYTKLLEVKKACMDIKECVKLGYDPARAHVNNLCN